MNMHNLKMGFVIKGIANTNVSTLQDYAMVKQYQNPSQNNLTKNFF